MKDVEEDGGATAITGGQKMEKKNTIKAEAGEEGRSGGREKLKARQNGRVKIEGSKGRWGRE